MGCLTVVRGKAIRVTEVNECGAVPDDAVYVVSKGFVQVALSVENEAGDEFVVKNADGDLCVNERAPDALKRLTAAIDWCEVDPAVMNLITGSPTVPGDSPGDPIGFDIIEGAYTKTFALEIWTGLAGTRCADGNICYGYFLLPLNTGGSLTSTPTIQNGNTTFQTTSYTVGGAEWGVGPYNVEGEGECDAPLTTPIAANVHARIMRVCCAPPVPSCGSVPVQSVP